MKTRTKKPKWVAVRIRQDVLEMAKRQADKQGRSTANYIEQLIYEIEQR